MDQLDEIEPCETLVGGPAHENCPSCHHELREKQEALEALAKKTGHPIGTDTVAL